MLIEQQLLNRYKEYDHLNSDEQQPLVKILVSYIKPSFLFKSEILTPIQLGKAVEKAYSKDGVQSDENLKWLHENCEFNDDFEGGISEHNRRVGFLTGTYWAWKNYEKLGNPEYFGSFGYRRLLNSESLKHLKNTDMIIPEPRKLDKTYKERLIDYLGEDFFNKVINVIKIKCEKNIMKDIENYINQETIYFDELYVMKRDLFFKFCEWIFPILQELLKLPVDASTNRSKLTTKDILLAKCENRDIAYIIEFLTGFFICREKISKKFFETETILLYNDTQLNMFEILRKRMKNTAAK